MPSALSEPPPRVELATARDGAIDVVLRDGSTVHVRPTVAADVAAVATFLDGLSPEARWFRFMGGGISAERAARGLIDRGVGLIATAGADGHVVAHACFVPENTSDRAELAFAVADAWQGRGIGTLMLAHLAQLAEATGAVTLTAFVHPDNHRMLSVLRDSGFAMDVRAEPGLLEIELPAQLSAAARARFEERDRTAAVAAVRHVLTPASIAVVGASRRQGSVGGDGGPQPGRRRLRRPRVPDQPARPDDRRPTGVRDGGRCAHPGGAGHHRRRRARACSTRRAPARPRECPRSSSSRPASARRAPRGGHARQSCWASAARRECGSSDRTASAS